MHTYRIQVRYGDSDQLFAWLAVNEPDPGRYYKSMETCQPGIWRDSDLSLPGGVVPGGTVFYDESGDNALFRLGTFKAGSPDTWPLGFTSAGTDFTTSRKLKFKIIQVDDDRLDP